jgi:hypothetical protein
VGFADVPPDGAQPSMATVRALTAMTQEHDAESMRTKERGKANGQLVGCVTGQRVRLPFDGAVGPPITVRVLFPKPSGVRPWRSDTLQKHEGTAKNSMLVAVFVADSPEAATRSSTTLAHSRRIPAMP